MISKNVRKYRKLNNLKQKELGLKSGLFNQQEISNIEKGVRKSFKPDELTALANALKVTVTELLADDTENERVAG